MDFLDAVTRLLCELEPGLMMLENILFEASDELSIVAPGLVLR